MYKAQKILFFIIIIILLSDLLFVLTEITGFSIFGKKCVLSNGLPDKECTPGDVFDVSTKEICTIGYTKQIRSVTKTVREKVYNEYKINKINLTNQDYELDHLIPLELGGSNDITNLWPEVAEPKPGFHEKDRVENYLHNEICKGLLSLEVAQKEIATNWTEVWQRIK